MFGKKEQQSTVDDYNAGVLRCSNCRKRVPFTHLAPLGIAKCELCSAGYNFVPMRIDRFWLFKPLGGGGMGSVYEAFIENDDSQTAAVKVLPRDKLDDPIVIAGLETEIEIMERLGYHPCIVSMLGGGISGW